MRHGGVHADHQIKICHDGSSIGKVGNLRGQIEQGQTGRRIRRLVFAGKECDAEALFNKTMMGKPVDQMKYQPLGDLLLEFPKDHQLSLIHI